MMLQAQKSARIVYDVTIEQIIYEVKKKLIGNVDFFR